MSPSAEHLHVGSPYRYASGCRCWSGSRPDRSDGCREAWRVYRSIKERARQARPEVRARRQAKDHERRVTKARALVAEADARAARERS